MLVIDGSLGEGGGQILRSSLALSLVTGKPLRLENIRARRKKPGLLHQHLTAVRAAAAIGRAETEGAQLRSQSLTFLPGEATPGEYYFSVGTAGSATLVLQAVLPALLCLSGPSQLTLEGGTHNPFAPTFHYLQRVFTPLLNRMGRPPTGPWIEMELHRPGFYPAGGGKFTVRIKPATTWRPLHLSTTTERAKVSVKALVSQLPRHIAQREVDVVARKLSLPKDRLTVEEVADSPGPGNVVMIEITRGEVTEMFTGFGQRGVKAETVAAGAAREAKKYLKSAAPIGPHLADQLLIPMALAGGGSFYASELTLHTKTNIEVIKKFLDVDIRFNETEADGTYVEIGEGPLR